MPRTAALIVAVCTAALSPQANAPKELEPLQGRWLVTSVNGKTVPPEAEAAFMVTGDQYVQGAAGKVVERGTLKIDATKKPMTIDFIITAGRFQGSTQLGLIEIGTDTVRIQVNQPGAKERPADFAIKEGFELVTARRRTSERRD